MLPLRRAVDVGYLKGSHFDVAHHVVEPNGFKIDGVDIPSSARLEVCLVGDMDAEKEGESEGFL